MGRIVTTTTQTTTIKIFPADRRKMADAIYAKVAAQVPNCPPIEDYFWEEAAEAAVDSLVFEGAERRIDRE
jgi:hypothetical protein